MSQFQKAVATLERVVELLKSVENGTMELDARVHGLKEAKNDMSVLAPRVDKMKATADIKDEDKKVYGEAMVEKVNTLHGRFGELRGEVDREYQQALVEFSPVEAERNKAMVARREQEEADAAKALEEEAAKEAERLAEEAKAKEAEEAAHAKERERLRLIKEEQDREAKRLMDIENKRREELNAFLDSCSPIQTAETALRQLYSGTSSEQGFQTVVTAALDFITNVLGHPESESLRQVRKANPRFQEDIGRHPGGTGLLFAVGFRETYTMGGEVFLELKEPSPTKEYERWKAWYDETSVVKSVMEFIIEATGDARREGRPLQLEAALSRGREACNP